jgi:heme exporter protein B
MLRTLSYFVWRELTLALRRRMDILTTLFFFVVVVSLFPLAIGPQVNLLRTIAPGIVWVAALLASLLSLSRLFEADYLDGTLEQLMLSPQPLVLLILGKTFAHWLLSGLPLSSISLLLAAQYSLDTASIVILVSTLLIGTPVLSLIGSVGAALTLGLRSGSVLLSLLVLPLYVPVLIFGAGAVEASTSGVGTQAYFSLLGASLALALVFSPWAAATALRIAME